MVVLLPSTRIESVNNLADLQGVLEFTLFWALIWRPKGPIQRWGAAALCLLIGGTTPLAAVFLPVVLFRVLNKKDRNDVWFGAGGWLAGVGLQGVAMLVHGLTRSGKAPNGAFLHNLIVPVLDGSLLGPTANPPAAVSALIVLLWVSLIGSLAVLLYRSRAVPWAVQRGAVALAAAVCVFLMTLAETHFGLVGGWYPRYDTSPTLLLYSLLALTLQTWVDTRPRARIMPRLLCGTAVVWLTTLVALNYPATAYRNSGSPWSTGIVAARAACVLQEPRHIVRIPISPVGMNIYLRCRVMS